MKQNNEISILLEALKYFYPVYFGEEIRPTKPFFEYGGQKYKKGWVLSETFRITEVPENTSDVGVAIRELERIHGSEIVEPPKPPVEASLPQAGTRAVQAETLKQREEGKAKADIKGKEKAQEFLSREEIRTKNIEKLRKFQKAVEGKTIYAEIKESEETKLEADQEKVISDFKAEAIKDPEGLKAQVADVVESRLKEIGVPGATDQQISDTAIMTAENMVGIWSKTSPIVGAMVIKEASNTKIFQALAGDTATNKIIIDYSDLQIAHFMDSKRTAGKVFGERFAERVFKVPEIVRVLDSPTPSTTPFAVSKILSVPTPVETVVKQPIFDKGIEKYNFRSSMAVFKPTGISVSPVPIKKGFAQIIDAIKGPKISVSQGPLKTAVSGIGKFLADFTSKAKIFTSKNLESKQGLMIVGGAVAAIAGVSTGASALTIAGSTSTVVGFSINPGNVFNGTAFTGIVAPIVDFIGSILNTVIASIALPIVLTIIVLPLTVALFMFIINSGAYVVPPSPIGSKITAIPPGGNLTKCDPGKTGNDITSQLASSMKNASVQLLPNYLGSRQDGICMDPTMIVLHTSSGYDNDDGNIRTYETLVKSNVSCQLATDTNDTILMLNFFEKQVEYSWCADNLNAGGVSIEMAGEPDAGFGPYSKCAPTGDQTFTPNGPHPCPDEEDLAFSAVCRTMQQYNIPWTQVFQHEASNGSHVDPNGDAWVDKFILRLKNNCPISVPNRY